MALKEKRKDLFDVSRKCLPEYKKKNNGSVIRSYWDQYPMPVEMEMDDDNVLDGGDD